MNTSGETPLSNVAYSFISVFLKEAKCEAVTGSGFQSHSRPECVNASTGVKLKPLLSSRNSWGTWKRALTKELRALSDQLVVAHPEWLVHGDRLCFCRRNLLPFFISDTYGVWQANKCYLQSLYLLPGSLHSHSEACFVLYPLMPHQMHINPQKPVKEKMSTLCEYEFGSREMECPSPPSKPAGKLGAAVDGQRLGIFLFLFFCVCGSLRFLKWWRLCSIWQPLLIALVQTFERPSLRYAELLIKWSTLNAAWKEWGKK